MWAAIVESAARRRKEKKRMRRNENEQSAELRKDILSVLIYAVCLSIVGYAFMGRFGLLLGVLPLGVLVSAAIHALGQRQGHAQKMADKSERS